MIDKSKLKELALAAQSNSFENGSSLTAEFLAFMDEANPAAILELLDELEARNLDYVEAHVDRLNFSDRIMLMQKELESARNAGLHAATMACEAERIEPEESYMTLTKGDQDYNLAIEHCTKAIRSLATTTSTEPAAPASAACDSALRAEPAGQHDAGGAALAHNKHFTPMEARGALVYLGRSGGFDVRDCPEPEHLAAFIVAACNDAATRSRAEGGNTNDESTPLAPPTADAGGLTDGMIEQIAAENGIERSAEHWGTRYYTQVGSNLFRFARAIESEVLATKVAQETDPWKWFADKAIVVLQRHIVPDGLSDHDALTELYGIFDGPEMRAMGTIPQIDCDARQSQAMREDRQVAMLAASPAAAVAAPIAGSQQVPGGRLREKLLRVAKESEHHLAVWLEQDDCDCEGAHSCGKPLVQATLHDLKEVIAALDAAGTAVPGPAEQVKPFAYLPKSELAKLDDPRIAGVGMMVSKEPAEHRVAIYLAAPSLQQGKEGEAS